MDRSVGPVQVQPVDRSSPDEPGRKHLARHSVHREVARCPPALAHAPPVSQLVRGMLIDRGADPRRPPLGLCPPADGSLEGRTAEPVSEANAAEFGFDEVENLGG